MRLSELSGVGLGLRWEFLEEALAHPELPLAFLEVSPENLLGRGGYLRDALSKLRERCAFVSHGLGLSLGSVKEPEPGFLQSLKAELEWLGAPWHSEHLSFSYAGAAMTHELLPLPRTRANARRIAGRIARVERALGRPLLLENISAYLEPPGAELDEGEFMRLVLEESGAGLLLDVNNVYVNARNTGQDPLTLLQQFPLSRVTQIHIAGYEQHPSGLLIDTHGAPVSPEVRALLSWVIEHYGPLPVLLERDNDLPSLEVLLAEVQELEGVYTQALAKYQGQHSQRAEISSSLSSRKSSGTPQQLDAHQFKDQVLHDTEPDQARLEQLLQSFAFTKLPAADAKAVRTRLDELLGELSFPPGTHGAWLAQADRLALYRSFIRGTLRETLEQLLPRTLEYLGEAELALAIEAFLTQAPPRTPLVRDLAPAFARFAAPYFAARPKLQPWLSDLARYEALRFEVRAAPDAEHPATSNQAPQSTLPALASTLTFSRSSRLLYLDFAVHELASEQPPLREPERRSVALFLYRDASHALRHLELSQLAAKMVEALLAGQTLARAVTEAYSAQGVEAEPERLAATAELLADFAERGAILAFQARPEPMEQTPSDLQHTATHG